MLILPVAGRELLTQARRTSTYWMRVTAGAVAGFLMLWILLVSVTPMPTSSQGKILFTILSNAAFVYCLTIGAFATADCLSTEKREGTLGLLFLTDLRGFDVILGKLVSSSLHCAYGLVVVFPMMAMALLFGGVSMGEILRTSLVLANTMFFSLSAGMFVSTLSRNDRKAVFMTILLISTVAAVPYELGYFLASNFAGGTASALNESVLTPSPIYAFSIAQSAMGAFKLPALYTSVAETQAVAWLLLAVASVIVPRICKDRPQRAPRTWGRKPGVFGARVNAIQWRGRLLERNPFYWLGSRERRKAALVWVLILPLSAIGGWVWWKYVSVFYETALVLVIIIQVLLKIWFIGETCHRWIEDRQSGALELLLCVPRQTREIVRGQGLALRRQFGWAVVATLGLSVVAYAIIRSQGASGTSMQPGRAWLLASMPILVADLVAARWVAAWQGLTARGLNRAIVATLARVFWFRWGIYLFFQAGAGTWQWLGLGPVRFVASVPFWLMLALVCDLSFGWSARRRFLRYFRVVAANPMDYRAAMRATASAPDDRVENGIPKDRSASRAGRRSRRLKLALWTTAVILLIGVPWGYRYQLSLRVAQRIRAAEQAKLIVARDELERRRPPLVNGVDAALVLEQSSRWFVASRRLPPAVFGRLPRGGYPERSAPLPRPMKEAMVVFLSTNQYALDKIASAGPLRTGRYIYDFKTGGGRFVAQMETANTLGELYEYQVILHADEDDTAGALVALRRLLDLAHSLNDETWIMCQDLRRRLIERCAFATERLLNRCRLSEPDLKELEQQFIEAENQTDVRFELMAFAGSILENHRSPPGSYLPAGARFSPFDQFRMHLLSRVYTLTGTNDRDFLRNLDTLEQFASLLRLPWPERVKRGLELARRYRTPESEARRGSLFRPKFLVDVFLIPNAELAAHCRGVASALAVERYRLAHEGRLPEKLEVLIAGGRADFLQDPFASQLLRYVANTPGYRVYSVGQNGVDEQGAGSNAERATVPLIPGDDISVVVER